jgi:prepilin-type N-terminal cleavage/methylation domain-containing protein
MSVSRSKKGFTLAEVLITLLIIGVVASLVIPALIGDTQQAELKVGLKKAVATLNQALALSIAQDSTDATGFASGGSTSNLMNLFANKINVISNNGTNTITTADGSQFTFYTKAVTSCDASTSTVDDIPTASCYVLVDVNGTKKPNTLSASGAFKDQYYLIIRQKTVVPAKNTTAAGNDMAQQAMYK